MVKPQLSDSLKAYLAGISKTLDIAAERLDLDFIDYTALLNENPYYAESVADSLRFSARMYYMLFDSQASLMDDSTKYLAKRNMAYSVYKTLEMNLAEDKQ